METTDTGSRGTEARSLVYPESPWEPGPLRASSLFREFDSEESEGLEATVGFIREAAAALTVPVRYEYRVEPGFELDPDSENHGEDGDAARDGRQMECEAAAESEQGRQFRELLASECAKAEERGHSQGMALGLAEGRKDGREEAIWQLRAGTEEERQRFAERTEALLRTLDEDRDRYIHRLEQESARLALAVAARILRREAEADPLLLTGAVRVALGQLAASTVVRLRVPAADLSIWTETLANIPNLHIRPELIADSRMGLGECRLETELGSADLGLTGQLEVLEHRFFDRDRLESKEGLAEEAMRPDAGTVPSPAPPKGAAR